MRILFQPRKQETTDQNGSLSLKRRTEVDVATEMNQDNCVHNSVFAEHSFITKKAKLYLHSDHNNKKPDNVTVSNVVNITKISQSLRSKHRKILNSKHSC
ncbi:hypothetical protein P5V15_012203 [Pogonomyrmex californicus]